MESRHQEDRLTLEARALAFNPVQSIRLPPPDADRDRRLARGEEQALLDGVDAHSNPMLGWLVRLALETAMRDSDLVSLQLSQIDLERRVARLSQTKNGIARTLLLSLAAVRILREAMSDRARPIDSDLIFFESPGATGAGGRISL